MIPWEEWRDSILGEKPKDDGFKKGDGVKNAERILKRMAKKGYRRPATKEEIKEIEERNERRAKK